MLRTRTALTLAAPLAFLLAGAPASAAPITVTTTLLGSNEVPPNASTATGTATITFDPVANFLSVNEIFSGLIGGPAAAAHIHCCALPGVNAQVAVPFTGFPNATSGTYVITFDLTLPGTYTSGFLAAGGGTAAGAEALLLASIINGMAYVNIHDAVFPGGEIRGQLGPIPEPATLTLLGLGLAGARLRFRRRSGR